MSANLASKYIARGWAPIPIPFREKGPRIPDWQNLRLTEADVPNYFNGGPSNIGVLLGNPSGGLTDVDLDSKEAQAVASYFLPQTNAIFGRKSAPSSHWLYKTTLATEADKATINFDDPLKGGDSKRLLELRIGGSEKGAQTVFPGSTHKDTGETVVWEKDGDPLEISSEELSDRVCMVAAAALLVRYWPQPGSKNRHTAALALGGTLGRHGWPVPKVKLFVEAVTRTARDEEVNDRIKAAADSVENVHTRPVYGVLTLYEAFDKPVVDQVLRWIGYEGQADEQQQRAYSEPEFNSPEEYPEPLDLWRKHSAPKLPSGLLPGILEDFARAESELTGADAGGFAAATLAVCAAAIRDRIKLQIKQHDHHWKRSARLWVALVGEVSTMKSPIMDRTTRSLKAIDHRMYREYIKAKTAYDAMPKEDRHNFPPPENVRILLEDTTIEAAQEVFKFSHDGVFLLQDELSGWFGAMDKYSGAGKGASKDRGFWLQAYNGGSYGVNRIGRGAFLVENLSVSMLAGIQPSPMRKIAADSYDDGLVQRLTPIMLGNANFDNDSPPPPIARRYDELIEKLHGLDKPRFSGNGNLAGVAPCDLTFDEEAQENANAIRRYHRELMDLWFVNPKLAAHVGKYDNVFASLCVVWHCVENADAPLLPNKINAFTVDRVGTFLHGFLLRHANAFYWDLIGVSTGRDTIRAIAGYILTHPELEVITARDVARGDRAMRALTKREAEEELERLENLGWLVRAPGARRHDAQQRFIVNPKVSEKFADRAKQEALERRRGADATRRAMWFDDDDGAENGGENDD